MKLPPVLVSVNGFTGLAVGQHFNCDIHHGQVVFCAPLRDDERPDIHKIKMAFYFYYYRREKTRARTGLLFDKLISRIINTANLSRIYYGGDNKENVNSRFLLSCSFSVRRVQGSFAYTLVMHDKTENNERQQKCTTNDKS